ncbi:MAG: hypothetical protein ACO1TE_05730 [Prosthecobacter sp.]
MKLDLQSLSTEPLVYMLMHSGAFVTVLGIVFFLIGLLFGRFTWGRYKRQTRELRGEAEAMKEELANLKRKLGDLSVKSGPAVPIVTEMIPLPKKESPASAAAPAAAVAVSEGKKSPDKSSLPASPASAPAPEQPSRPQGNVIKSKAPAHAEPAANGTSAASGSVPTAPGLASVSIPTIPDAASAAGHHASALAAIIAPSAAPKKEPDPSLEKDMLVLPEIPVPGTAATAAVKEAIKPEFDPQLGLIYRAKPEQSDDLTALKGVARTLEQRLHALGVYTYEQIAGWTQDQIREFSSRLAFKDRIQREQWVEQARQLLASRQQLKQPAAASAS